MIAIKTQWEDWNNNKKKQWAKTLPPFFGDTIEVNIHRIPLHEFKAICRRHKLPYKKYEEENGQYFLVANESTEDVEWVYFTGSLG